MYVLDIDRFPFPHTPLPGDPDGNRLMGDSTTGIVEKRGHQADHTPD